MSSKMIVLVVAFLVCTSYATEEGVGSQAALRAMEKVFARSEQAHAASMAAISRHMSPKHAWHVLEKGNLTSPALIELHNHLQGKKSSLRKPSGLDGARKLLNDMIYESMTKYDEEIAKCTMYYASQCAAMQAARGQISASNYIAANSRSLILDAQSNIGKCESDIPEGKEELNQHNKKCKGAIDKMRQRMKVVLGDIEVITMILKMTDCKKKSFVQMEHCRDPCSKKTFVSFTQQDLKQKVSQLQSSVSHELMHDSFRDMFEGIESLESVALQDDSTTGRRRKTTAFNNAPVPRTQVPGDPCTDPSAGAPSASTKRSAKCTISGSPKCYKLQERFLGIQSGLSDEKDNLMDSISTLESSCQEQRETIETKIQDDEDMLSESQTKLAGATTKEANAGEKARQTAKENSQLNDDLKKQMKTCSTNYINFETEMCGLKKIRGELYKMKSAGSAFFQDCEVSPWAAEECSKECRGGEQKLSRTVMSHPNGGAKCLPLAAKRSCNTQPCPVDCKLSSWSGWSKCSADCGGGVQQRLKEVKQAMKAGGKPCGETSQTKACKAQACEVDCTLSRWSKWSACSKECDGGTQKRAKFVKTPAQGSGKCASKWNKQRLQYKKCNMHSCLSAKATTCSTWEKDANMYDCKTVPTCCDGYRGMGLTSATVQCVPSSWASADYKVKCAAKAMQCKKKLDVVFLLDGSGSLRKKGWDAEMVAANQFIDAFSGTGAQAEMSVILYSGPRTWSGVRKCFRRNSKKVDLEKTCKIKSVTHFEKDMKKVKEKVADLTWPQGSTLTSLALLSAKSELSLGRKDAQSVIIVITDGRPFSYRATYYASRAVRKSARLVWVPVTRYAPLRRIKRWATRRWQENVVKVNSFKELENPATASHIVANICPSGSTRVKFSRKRR